MTAKYYCFSSIGLILGVILYKYFSNDVLLAVFVLAVLLLLLFRNFRACTVFGLLIIFFSIGGLLYKYEVSKVKTVALDGKNCLIEGIVNSQPKKKPNGTSFFFKVKKINNKNRAGFLWVSSKKPVDINFGDRLTIRGTLGQPSQKEFKDYLLKKRVKNICYINGVTEKRKTYLSAIGELQSKIEGLFSDKDDAEALLLASFIGNTGKLSEASKSDFKASGLAHLWSVSGLHVGCLMLFILALARLAGLKPLTQILVTTFLLFLYTFLAGLSPPVVRSAIMGFLVLLTWFLGRKKDLISVFYLTFIVMVLYDPFSIFDIGFQLSFSSVLGILLLQKGIEKLFWDWPSFLKTSVAVTLSAQIATTPFMLYHFGSFPVYSLIANSLAIPLVMPLMVLVLLYIMLSQAPGSFMIKYLAALPAKMILIIASMVSNLPFSRLYLNKPVYIVTAIIVAFFGAILAKKHKVSLATCLIALAAVILTGCFSQQLAKPSGFEISFLDIGQGDSALITDKNVTVLIDGGPDYEAVAEELKKRGISTIDIVVLTHPNADHATGLVNVVKDFKVGLFLDSGFPQPSYIYKEILTEVKDRKIKYLRVKAGKELQLGSIIIKILNPPAELITGTSSDDNNNSIVLSVRKGDNSVLFTGDIEKEAEDLLVEKYKEDLKAGVIKVAHHGSAYSTSDAFLQAVQPAYAVISVGANNPYGHPSQPSLFRLKNAGSKIYRTDLNGTINIKETVNGFNILKEKD